MPTIEPPSGVKENIPFRLRAGSLGRINPVSAGNILAVSVWHTLKSSGVNGISEGCSARPGFRMARCGVTIGSCR